MKGLSRIEGATISRFRICIELTLPTSLTDRSPRIISFPSTFFEGILPRIVGLTEAGQNWCFNWRLQLCGSGGEGDTLTDSSIRISSMDNRTLFIIINELTDLLVHEELNKRLYVGSVPVPMDNDNNSESIITHTSSSTNYYPFISGHTEISSGIIHIFRELSKRHPTLPDEGGERVHVYRQFNEEDSSLGVLYEFLDDSVLLVLAIPTTLSPAEFLHFVGSDFVNCIERVRLVRDAAPNRYMAIIKFATPEMALNFSQERDGQAFTAQDPEVCHVVRVASVEFTTRAPVLEPLFDENEFIDEDRNYSYSSLESPNVIEIPTCPVCLERLDSTATGVMIGICNHKYHCQCLSRWGDNSCPVCRYALQGGKGGGRTVCSACDCHEDIWLCLICGVAGCGRYNSGHAHDHYSLTGHCFALELDSHRVWDYVGDKYSL